MKEKLIETIDDLRSFIKRVSAGNGTPEELAILPAVVQSLVDMVCRAQF